MNKLFWSAMLLVMGFISTANALPTRLGVSTDDYAELWIDGVLEASYDAYPQGHAITNLLDLNPGWHDITLIYKNRWGSNLLALATITGDTPQDYQWNIIPLESLRSLDASGNYIDGLRADYYTLQGDFVTTIYGEGPIRHGHYWPATPQVQYQDVPGALWAGIYDGWGIFEERLTGQVYIGGTPIPAPGSLLLAATGMSVVGWLRRRRSL